MTDVEQQLRAHLKRKLKILNGSGQITVRRLVKAIYQKKGYKYAEELVIQNKRYLYSLAAELCEEAGGKQTGIAYCRSKRDCTVAARVYQF